MLNTLPAELQAAIKDAFFSIQKNDPEACQVMTDGEQQLWAPITNADYQVIIDLNTFVDSLRKS
jgi:phosphonate transport system substrate-binding protein